MKKVGKNGSGGKNETKGMTRRDFIKGTAAAAGMAAGGSLFLGGVPPAIGQRKVKLTYWSRDYNEGDAKKYAAEFMKLHPEYDISVEGLPYSGMYEKMNTALMAGKSADLLSVSLPWMASFADLGFLHPLDKPWEKDISKADRDDYFPAGIAYCTFKGKLYGAPWRVDGSLLLWSVDAFKEVGLDPAKGPDTWEDVLAYAKKLTITEPGGKVRQHGICMGAKPPRLILDWFMAPLVWDLGGNFTDEKVTRSLMNEKPVIEAFKYTADLNTKYKVASPAAFNYVWSDISPVLAKRATAILFGHQANFNIIWKITPGMKLASGPFPKGPAGRFTQANGWCHAIASTAKVEDVWPFLLYLQDPMRQAVLTVGAPGRKAGVKHEKYDVFRKDPLIQYASMSGAEIGIVRGCEVHPLGQKIYDEIGRTVSEAWEGKITPEDAAAKAHARVNTIIKEG
jgi:multiple sugar transport system substrate-binding protein